MHNISFNNKQIITIIILIGLLAILPIALFLTQKRQVTRSKAAGTGEITVAVKPATGNIQQGGSLSARVVLTNVSSVSQQIYVAGVDLSYDPYFFTISNLACGTVLSNSAKLQIDTNAIYLSCFVSGGTGTYTIPVGATVILGTFTVTAKSGAALNTISNINVLRTNIPDAITGTDLSNAGAGAKYTIILTPTTAPSATPTIISSPTSTPTQIPTITPTKTPVPVTLTPTRTRTPTPTKSPTPTLTLTPIPIPTDTPVPTYTPTPTKTSTPQPTPTDIPIPSPVCPGADLGNISCDSLGLIDETDLSILLTKWHIGVCPAPTPSAGQAIADLNADCNVDELDLSRLLINWKAI